VVNELEKSSQDDFLLLDRNKTFVQELPCNNLWDDPKSLKK
jgi:hypothetical protein